MKNIIANALAAIAGAAVVVVAFMVACGPKVLFWLLVLALVC